MCHGILDDFGQETDALTPEIGLISKRHYCSLDEIISRNRAGVTTRADAG